VTTGDDAVSDRSWSNRSTPATATTNETIEVNATIRNPTEFRAQQPVEVRIDGAVFARQVLELEGGETRTVAPRDDNKRRTAREPVDRRLHRGRRGIRSIDLEFHTDPSVSVETASDGNVTVSAAIPEAGFVALERNGAAIGTTDRLEPGEHENVSLELSDDASIDEDEELMVALYAGKSRQRWCGLADRVRVGEPVRTTFTPADVETGDSDDGGPGTTRAASSGSTARREAADHRVVDGSPPAIVATKTIHTLIGQLSFDQACNDLQWLL